MRRQDDRQRTGTDGSYLGNEGTGLSLRRSGWILIVGMLLACVAGATAPFSQAETGVDQRVAEFMAQVVAGRFTGAVRLFHEPASYGSERAAADRDALEVALVFIDSKFGRVSNVRRLTEQAEICSIAISGGDVPYWRSLPNFGVDADALYRVSFASFGPGIVRLTLTGAGTRWEIRSAEFGFERSDPEGGRKARGVARGLLKQMMPDSPGEEIEREVDAMISASDCPEHQPI